jgi:activator of 2-hydroxyglutaryl-CoA dehydratase
MGNAKELIENGKAVLGIEFGSTRIKAVLVNEKNRSHRGAMIGKTSLWTGSGRILWMRSGQGYRIATGVLWKM